MKKMGGGREEKELREGGVIEREREERCWQSWENRGTMGRDGGWRLEDGETNGPAWRDRSQSIIFKQKQRAQENI